jgi:TetR/AcrR family transcriptional regulator, regulator of autoinduction and epiphytic fitness
MTPQAPTKRTYNSSRRKEQASQTRQKIMEAARSLFLANGYAGTTIEAIAGQAGVAAETVYAAFGNKRAILSQLLDISLVGDDRPVPLLERDGPQAAKRETDQRLQVALFADDMYENMSRVAPLFDLMRAAAKSEPEIAEMLQSILDSRLQGMMDFVRALLQNGPLRSGLTPEAAAETVWALSSAEIFSLLTVNRGWEKVQYRRWLSDTLTRLLLPKKDKHKGNKK